MSEVVITIDKVWTAEGVRENGNPWKRYDIKPTDSDARYKTFNAKLGKLAQEGGTFKATFSESSYGLDLEDLQPVEDNGDYRAKLGTGEYVGAKENPEKQRSIHASVALEQANLYVSNLPEEERRVLTEQAVLLVADKWFKWLRKRAEGEETGTTRSPSTDGDVPL